MIPSILHHTYSSLNIPPPFTDYIRKWKILNPELKQIIWTDEQNYEFVKKCYPKYLEPYLNLKFKIQRIDLVRYMYLHKFGGIYADIDLEPLKTIRPLLNEDNVILVLEPQKNALNKKFLISNYWMASVANSHFMLEVIETATQNFNYTNNYKLDVLNSTGCLMLNKVYLNYLNKKPILLQSELFSPLTHKEIIYKRQFNISIQANSDTYAIHHFAGSWW